MSIIQEPIRSKRPGIGVRKREMEVLYYKLGSSVPTAVEEVARLGSHGSHHPQGHRRADPRLDGVLGKQWRLHIEWHP